LKEPTLEEDFFALSFALFLQQLPSGVAGGSMRADKVSFDKFLGQFRIQNADPINLTALAHALQIFTKYVVDELPFIDMDFQKSRLREIDKFCRVEGFDRYPWIGIKACHTPTALGYDVCVLKNRISMHCGYTSTQQTALGIYHDIVILNDQLSVRIPCMPPLRSDFSTLEKSRTYDLIGIATEYILYYFATVGYIRASDGRSYIDWYFNGNSWTGSS